MNRGVDAKSTTVSADSFAATRCTAAPVKRAATDWHYHIGRGTRLLLSLSCRQREERRRKGEERTIGRLVCLSLIRLSRFLPRSSTFDQLPRTILLPLLRSPIYNTVLPLSSECFSHVPFSISRSSDSRPRELQSRSAETSTPTSTLLPIFLREPLTSSPTRFRLRHFPSLLLC